MIYDKSNMTTLPANSDLGPRLEAVAKLYVENQDVSAIAAELGVTEELVKALLSSRQCNVIILHLTQQHLLQISAKALKVLEDMMDNPALAAVKGSAIRLAAAKTVLDRAGLIAPKARDPEHAKSLEEMDRDELLGVIRQAEHALSDRAVPVDPVPEGYVSDILD